MTVLFRETLQDDRELGQLGGRKFQKLLGISMRSGNNKQQVFGKSANKTTQKRSHIIVRAHEKKNILVRNYVQIWYYQPFQGESSGFCGYRRDSPGKSYRFYYLDFYY